MRTPLRRSQWLSAASGAEVSIKLEGIQTTFSYKLRGALNAVLRLQERQEHPPALVTASAGNHGRGLAVAAAIARLPLIVYVPEDAPRIKLDAIRAAGAEVIPCRDYDEAEARAKEHGARGPAMYISPYSHPDVIAGAGTVALEILEQDPGVEMIVLSDRRRRPDQRHRDRARGPMSRPGASRPSRRRPSLRDSRPAASSPSTCRPSLADGLTGNLDPETITFDLVRRHVAGIVTVSEPAIAEAIGALVAEERVDCRRCGRDRGCGGARREGAASRPQGRDHPVRSEHRPAQAARADLAVCGQPSETLTGCCGTACQAGEGRRETGELLG